MSKHRGTHRRWGTTPAARRHSTAMLAVALLAAVFVSGPPAATEAAWVDNEWGRASLTARVIAAPVATGCVLTPGALGLSPQVRLTWQFAQPTSYTAAANVNYYVAKNNELINLASVSIGANLTTTGPVSGVYTTTFYSGLLSGLLGGVYGVFVQAKEGDWTSALAGGVASMALLGINPQCTILPA